MRDTIAAASRSAFSQLIDRAISEEVAALFTDAIAARVRQIGKAGRWLYKGAGVAMIIMGIAIMTGQLSRFAYWLLGTFPFLATIG